MIVFTDKGNKLIIEDSPLASGGEGEVRKIINDSKNIFTNHCVKIYYKNKRTSTLKNKISFMVANPPENILASGYMICWPQAIILDENEEFIGFVMPLAFEGTKSLINLTTLTINKKIPSAWHEKFGRENGGYAVVNRLKLIHNILIPIVLLHSTYKYVIQDFKPENVLITANGRICLLDMDSIQISNGSKVIYPGTAATPEYVPPENYSSPHCSQILPSWDMFGVGVVIYKILLGIHPYAVIPKNIESAESNDIGENIRKNFFAFGENSLQVTYAPPHKRFNVLPDSIKNLFLLTFSDKPENRPTALEWFKEIKDILENVKNNPPKPPKKDTDKETDKATDIDYTPVPEPQPLSPNPPKNNSLLFWLLAIIVVLIVIILAVFT